MSKLNKMGISQLKFRYPSDNNFTFLWDVYDVEVSFSNFLNSKSAENLKKSKKLKYVMISFVIVFISAA